jgi:hypothetical protein
MSKVLSGAENRPRIVNEAIRNTQSALVEAQASIATKANAGANTDITSVYLNNTGLKVKDTDASHGLTLKPGSNLSADKVLTLTTGDADRTLTIGADSSISGTAYVASGTDVPVADGGTGRSDATAYAVICGGTTSTAAHQSIASVGTAGQVLTSNGAGALPTFQAGGGVATIASGSLSSSSVTISSIPATYTVLVLQVSGWSASSNSRLRVRVGTTSADATAGNYVGNVITGTTVTNFTTNALASMTDSNLQFAAETGTATVVIEGYWAGPHKRFNARSIVPSGESQTFGTYIGATTAIDVIEISTTAGNFDAGTYALYGR